MAGKVKMIVGSDNVFRDLGFEDGEAQNMLMRADLMALILKRIRAKGMTQADAAKLLGVTQPRLSDLYRHKIDKFSVDALVNIAGRAGLSVRLQVRKAA